MAVDTDMNISPVLGKNTVDSLTGTGRCEVLSGARGDDIIQALSGNDEVFGGTGNDILYGQAGNDIMYGNGKPSYVDMSDFTIKEATTATVTFMDEGAGYRNSLGVYEIAEDGSITNVKILFANASKQGSGGNLIPGESNIQFDVEAGAQLGFFVVSNGFGKGYENRMALMGETGTFEMRTVDGDPANSNSSSMELWYIDEISGEETHIRSQFGFDIFHSIGSSANNYAPNPDEYLHVVGRANTVTGDVLIGFEDIRGGGDNDYDDTIINIELGQTNVIGMLPEKAPSSGNLPDDDILYGGDGDDILFGISGNDHLEGGSGNDELSGNSGNDKLFGNDGVDILNGNSGDDILQGGAGNDQLSGNSGDDDLSGDGGDDTISAGSGHDRASGGSGNDTVSGGSGMDILFGGSGKDTLNGNSGNDTLYGDSGSDILNGHSGNDALFGGNGSDKLIGGGGEDILMGGANNDKLYGGSGDDRMSGGDGNDYLTGSSGNDIINGGAGNDKLRGGSGEDTFVFNFSDGDLGSDRIYDFDSLDTLSFVNSSCSEFADIADHMSQSGDDVIIDFGDQCTVTVHDISLDSLTQDNFIFG